MGKLSAAAPEQEKPHVSISSVVVSDEPAPSRQTLSPEVPVAWLDALLGTLCELPVDAGEAGAVQALVDVIGRSAPATGVGATLSRDGETRLFRAVTTRAASSSGEVSSRMFPEFAHERTIELAEAGPGVTLHLASDDAAVVDESAPLVKLLNRSGNVFRAALTRVAEHERSVALARELHSQREQLIFAEKLATLGQMAAGLVHELNNPLTAIVAYTDFLLKRRTGRDDDGYPDETERIRRIAESAHRMQRFTRDLVTYARPSGGDPQPVVISSIIDQALSFCEHLLEESGVTVTREFGDGVLPVRGMPEQLAQVFVNLFTNACHAMPERGGLLIVRTEVDDAETHARVVIEDNGHGISADNLPRLFVPFFTTKPEGHGTGLGLSIVKRIIEGHDGTITVTSQPEAGTRFVVVLPVAQGPNSQRLTRP